MFGRDFQIKARVPVLIALATLVPIGIAVADYSDTPSVEGQPGGHAAEIVAAGEHLVQRVAATREQLATAIRKARESGDQLLATCLEDRLDEVDRLQAKAASELSVLRAAQNAEGANLPYVVLTVVGQKANQAAQQAARCVGADQQAGLSTTEIAPPSDPNAKHGLPGDQFDPQLPAQGIGLPIGPAPAQGPSTTLSPSIGDMPMDMPATPTAASPVL